MRGLVALLVLILPYFTLSQPTANFTADITDGCSPVIVRFTDQSQGAVQWEWRTGVGSSNQQNPSILYLNSGSYSVTLIVTDANGLKDTLTKSNYIQINDFPTAQLQANQTNICAFESITFSDLSNPGSGVITSWQWDFGDGNISSQANPTHTYTQAGTYPISLIVENQFGCQDEVILPNYITVRAPDPSFNVDQTIACGPPLDVNFTPSTNSGSHFWTFGDGNSSILLNPMHSYTQFGTFDVMHVVVDNQGCRDTLTRNGLINLGVNTLSIRALDSSICVFDTAFFQSNAPSNSQIIWDFGNGDSSTLANPFYVYTSPGSYTATAFISDSGGCNINLQIPIQVFGKPQVNIGTVDTAVGCALPFQVDFTNQSTGGLSYTWNFGDGSPVSTQTNPSHNYITEDTFTVSLAVRGPGGCLSSRSFPNYVLVKRLEAGFQTDKRDGCAPMNVLFTDTTLSPFPITSWDWDFGNGSVSSNQNSSANYSQAGTFDVSLIVENSQGCKDTVQRNGYIQAGLKPNVDFVIDTNKACAYAPASFTNLSTGASDFIWYFSDGDTAMSFNALHGFGALGMMDVTLIGNDRGCRDTMTKNNLIEILAPLPIMGISDRSICEVPKQVNFTDISIGADRTTWFLNNAFVTNQRNWSQSFTQDGFYPVAMTVENFTTGCVITSNNGITIKQVKADFVPDTNRSCVPFTVNFIDSSINAVKWNWHFGYGSDSAQVQNPTFTYPETGVFNPYVVVTNSINCKDTFTYNAIHALGIDAQFSIISDSVGCVPLDVQFQDLSTSTGNIINWDWNMGDTTFYSSPNPGHTFNYQSFFDIQLTVTDEDGCVDSVTKSNKIYATQPIPDFLINPPVNCSDNEVVFVSLSSGAGLTYNWDFGDGNSSTLANPAHPYGNNGLYTVSLTVTDVNGCDTSIVRSNSVLISEINADFVADTTFAPCPPLTVNFEADTAFPHENISYIWDFGDGASSREAMPSHIYTLPGEYTVQLIVETASGCSDTMIIDQFIQILGPTATMNINPVEGCPGDSILFEANSAFNVSYDWILGDGNTASGQQAYHTYSSPGTYKPVLVIEDSAGCEVFHVSPQDIVIHTPPLADFLISDSSFCDSGVVRLTPVIQSQSPVSTYLWTSNHGSSSSLSNPSFSFDQVGSYNIELQVEDQNGCRDTLRKDGLVNVFPSPELDIMLSDSSGCVPFSILATISPNGHPYNLQTYSWESPFGIGQNASFNLGVQMEGIYEIQLIAIDENGCVDSTSIDFIANPTPIASFSATDSFGCSPFLTVFRDESQGNANTWQWNFGDGGNSTLEQPLYTYFQDGIYSVSLRVENEFGCADSAEKLEYINLSHPEARFTVDPSSLCPNEPLIFTNLSSSDTLLAGFSWNFGDGNVSSETNPTHIYASSGSYDVSLVARDTFQCKDTLLLEDLVEVFEDIVPEPVDIEFVSVISDATIDIHFEAFSNQRGDFGSYQIMRKDAAGNYQSIGMIENINETTFTDKLPDTRLLNESQCYKVMVLNRCGTGNDLSAVEEHCSINVEAEAGIEQVLVNWTPYIGWDRIRSYQLFRVNNYDPNDMTLLGDFDQNTHEYLDLDMYCYDTYSYRLMATGPRPGIRSFSDTSFAEPGKLMPSDPSHILRVTVENDDFLQIDWELPNIEDAEAVILEKNDGNGFTPVFNESYANSNKKFQDQTVEVHDQSYAYRIFTVDSCGDLTPQGYTGNSIHLRTSQSGGQVFLKWNAYNGWPQGVDAYRIEMYDNNSNSYRVVARVSGTDTSYTHKDADESGNENCYHIIAEAAHSDETFSLSNEQCQWLEPVMSYPNAFTPNDDGINDVFLPQGYFLENYHLTIFDRWGKIQFESFDLSQGWNGYSKGGSKAPEGVYVFQVVGLGKSGTSFSRTGTISLVR